MQLDFNSFILNAELYNTKIANNFYKNLPYNIELTFWGNEAYGSIDLDLGKENPIPDIPAGGLAYTKQAIFATFSHTNSHTDNLYYFKLIC
ncbi:MAG: cyclophilin-like fold protein [bacterium]